ncbi:APC family permease [Kribbella sp. NPDC050124]|uniref:APC family permease n=1 Tax=Kribbella sp. NPDC050124 TaxID=3364114 RepID=UPI00378CF203
MNSDESAVPTDADAKRSASAAEPTWDPGIDEDIELLRKLGYKQELNRALGLFSSFGVQFSSIAIASALFTTLIVGLGFFGPASFWSYAIGGAAQVFLVGLAVGELVSAYPLSGGVYQIITRITRIRWLAWQSGWWLVIAHTVATAAVAVSLVPFLANWFGFGDLSGFQTSLFALALVVFVTIVNLAGVKAAALLNNVGVVAEIVGAVLIIGALLVVKHDTQPLSILSNTGGTTTGGWVQPLLFAMILPAYLISSFDATGNAAEETKNAAKTAPMGTFLANTLAYVVGLVFMFLAIRAIPDVDRIMTSETPMKDILDSAVGRTVTSLFEVIAIVALLATMAMLQLTGVRVVWSQARDGQLPAATWLRKVSSNRIPVNATFVCAALSIVFVFWSSALSVLAALTALAWALAYGVVVTAGLRAVVRKQLPTHPWRLGPASIPVFAGAVLWSVLLCVLLVWSDWKNVGLGMVGAIAVGWVLYLLIPASRRGKISGVDHSSELQQ